MKRRIIWLSNFRFSSFENCGSGAWIEAMGKGLASQGWCDIVNLTFGDVPVVVNENVDGIDQWVLPSAAVAGMAFSDLPSRTIIRDIVRIVESQHPDLIHIWGTERFWGLLTSRGYLQYPALLEMQGITSAIAPYVTGCLTSDEIRACNWIKEWLRPRGAMPNLERIYSKSFVWEYEMYTHHRFIGYQSEWVRSYVEPYAKQARLFKTRMMLRTKFLKAPQWSWKPNNHRVFVTCGWSAAKGTHVIVRACAMLQRSYPDLKLVVAGHHQVGVRKSGYTRWVEKLIERLHINVEILGAIDSSRMIDEMRRAAVFVHPSMVESYSMSLAEAMAVGCPCVASYAGAMPEVGGDACLYFPIADAGALAGAIEMLFRNPDKARELGERVLCRSREMHDITLGVRRQVEIYEEIFRELN